MHPVQHLSELTLTGLFEASTALVGPWGYLASACRDFGLIQSIEIILANLLSGSLGRSAAFLIKLILLVVAIEDHVVLSVAEVVQHRLKVFIAQTSHIVYLHKLISFLRLLYVFLYRSLCFGNLGQDILCF